MDMLLEENHRLRELSDRQGDQIAQLQHRVNDLLRLVYGVKSERFVPQNIPGMMTLPFAQADLSPVAAPEPVVQRVAEHERQRTSPKTVPHRSELPADLPRKEVVIEPDPIPEGAERIGQEVTETLEYEPPKFYVRRIVRPKYALADKSGVVIAELPQHPIPRCMAGTSLLLRIVIDKYLDHIPLWRQLARFKRLGVDLSESTMVGWVKAVAELIEPLYHRLNEQVLQSSYLGADETTIKVLDPKIRGKTHQGYLWVYLAHAEKLVLFSYDATRKKQVPGHMLRNFKGYLQTDGYAGYEQFSNHPAITRVGCMAHARRKFEKAKANDKARATVALGYYQRLYRVEYLARLFKIEGDALQELRLRISVPLLAEFKAWMTQELQTLTPKSPIAHAMAYSMRNWEELVIYTTDGSLLIDNNQVENKIRPVAVGRKNYLFMGSHEGSQRSAMLYSLVLSCALNGINPEEYLLDVMERLPDTKRSELDNLLPNKWQPATKA
jgi:transposase